MSVSTVASDQRFAGGRRCPVCGGADGDPRGQGRRCSGFTTTDGQYVHCAREEHAGAIAANGAGLFAHLMHGPCHCGTEHGPRRTNGNGSSTIIATYDYCDEAGELVYQVLRKEPKAFLQRRPDGTGGWLYKLGNVRRVPYRLQELVAADPDRLVYIVEGEKDADALVDRGQVATCNAGGATKWKAVADMAKKVLAGRSLVVIADADKPGRAHAEQVAASLHGVADIVRVIEMPGGHSDVSDFFGAGGTVEHVETIAADTNPWERPPRQDHEEPQRDTGDDLPKGVEPCSDLANAHRLRRSHGPELRFCRALGWLAWSGKCWTADETGEVMRRVHRTAQGMRVAAAESLTKAERSRNEDEIKIAKRSYSWAVSSQNGPRLEQMVKNAKVLDGIATTTAVFDGHDNLFPAANGTFDFETGKLGRHERKHMLTRCSTVAYDPDAESLVFRDFLDRIFEGNTELIRFVQRFVGYSLTGSTAEQVFTILYGAGANGKSTLLEALRYIWGDYAANTSADTLMVSRHGRGPDNDLARLRGARLVTASESGEARQLDEERVKRITGGDTVTARLLYHEPFEFVPQFKLWLATNSRPRIKGTNHAIWRRVMLIPFNVTIPKAEQDHALSAKLRSEASGILRWAVEGELERRRMGGLHPPPDVLQATEDYQADENLVGRFVAECCVVADHASSRSARLYEAFVSWCRCEGEEHLTNKAFSTELAKDNRFAKTKDKHGACWRGIGLPAPERGDG